MEDDDVGDIQREQITSELTAKQTEALALLYADSAIDKDLGHIAFDFGQDKDDLRQRLAMKLIKPGYDLHDLRGIKSWCHVTATHECINSGKHENVERCYIEKSTAESIHHKQSEGAILVEYSKVKTPEEELIEKEQASQVEDAFQKALKLFPRHEEIARLWKQGNSVNEIAEATGKSNKTIYPIVKKLEKAIVAEVRGKNKPIGLPLVA